MGTAGRHIGLLTGLCIGALAATACVGPYGQSAAQPGSTNPTPRARTTTPTTTTAATPAPTIAPTTTPAAASTATTAPGVAPHPDGQRGWEVRRSTLCAVSLPVPPREAPYVTPPGDPQSIDQGAFWQHEESDQYQSAFFSRSVNVFYRNPAALGSGYIAGIVTVACAPNGSGYTSDSFLTAYENKLAERAGQGIGVTSKQRVQRWGRTVWEVRHQGGMFGVSDPLYLFATPNYLYGVSTVSHTSNPFVKSTTAQIFDSIQFYD